MVNYLNDLAKFFRSDNQLDATEEAVSRATSPLPEKTLGRMVGTQALIWYRTVCSNVPPLGVGCARDLSEARGVEGHRGLQKFTPRN